MQAIEIELATAEFEALWLQARCYEGRASVGAVQEAMRRVDELRALADELAHDRMVSGPLSGHAPRPAAVAGN